MEFQIKIPERNYCNEWKEYSPRAVENSTEDASMTQLQVSNKVMWSRKKAVGVSKADIPGQVENIIPVEDKTEEEDHLLKKKE